MTHHFDASTVVFIVGLAWLIAAFAWGFIAGVLVMRNWYRKEGR